jgi:hypothetical protein
MVIREARSYSLIRTINNLEAYIITDSLIAVDSSDESGTEGGENLYLTTDGLLRHSVILRDSQTGFVGKGGHIWTIETDGSLRQQAFLNKDVREPEREGN